MSQSQTCRGRHGEIGIVEFELNAGASVRGRLVFAAQTKIQQDYDYGAM